MSDAVTITPPDGLADLGTALRQYESVSGKTASAVLLQKGAQLLFGNQDARYGATFEGLVQLFQDQKPAPGAILAAAKARGFRLGRKEFGGALSPTAIDRALAWMGGFKSILANVTEDKERISFRGVRLGRRGKRILGGRKGTGGFAIAGVVDADQRQPGEKVLNLRAVATAMEINLRESGRRFLGSAWLFRRWQKLAASDPRLDYGRGTEWRTLVNQNPRSRLGTLGEVALDGGGADGNAQIRITSFVPGTLAIGTSRNLFNRAIAGVRADIGAYLARKQRESLLDLLKSGRAA